MKRYEYLFNIQLTDLTNKPGEKYIVDLFNSYNSLWSEIKLLFSNFYIQTEYGNTHVSIDWNSAIKYTEKFFEIESKDFYSIINSISEEDLYDRDVNLSCTVSFESDFTVKEPRVINHLMNNLNLFLHNLFLVANLSSPGSINMISVIENKNTNYSLNTKLTSYSFLVAWEESKKEHWPIIMNIPLKNTWNWFNKLKIGSKQLAGNNIERALFGFLNLSEQWHISPTDLIWFTHILEALYNTKGTSIKSTLWKRIFLLLHKPKHYDENKKTIIELYNLRSSFVHGDLGIHHPARDETLDEKYDDYEENLIYYSTYAYRLIIGTMQKMITNDWISIQFKERYYGIK